MTSATATRPRPPIPATGMPLMLMLTSRPDWRAVMRPPVNRKVSARRASAQREGKLDVDPDWNRLAVATGRTEAPRLDRADGFLIETEVRIERPSNPDIPDAAVRPDDGFEGDEALHLGAHRIGRVVRARTVDGLGVRDPAPQPIDAATGAAAAALAETAARTAANPGSGPGAGARAASGAERRRVGRVRHAREDAGNLLDAGCGNLRRDVQLLGLRRLGFRLLDGFELGRLRYGNRNFFLPRKFRLPRRLELAVAATAATTAGAGLRNPYEVELVTGLRLHGPADGRKPRRNGDEQQKCGDVGAERNAQRVAPAAAELGRRGHVADEEVRVGACALILLGHAELQRIWNRGRRSHSRRAVAKPQLVQRGCLANLAHSSGVDLGTRRHVLAFGRCRLLFSSLATTGWNDPYSDQ